MDRTAFILGGGGITGGVYELGVLAAFDDFIAKGRKSADFDIFVGISAGSLLAAFLANGIPVAEMCRTVLGETRGQFALRREDIYDLRMGHLARAACRLVVGVVPVIRYLRSHRQPVTLLNVLALLQQFLPSGFFSNANLERYVSGILSADGRSNDFRRLRKKLYIAATEIDTGERWMFGQEGVTDDVPISRAIQASSAIPVFFEPVRIGDRYFVDGATERAAHLDVPLASGAKLIVIVNPTVPIYNDRTVVCVPTLSGVCSSLTETGFPNIAEQTFRINTRVKLELGVELYRRQNPSADILIIEPAQMESTLFLYGSMNFSERIQVLNYGYNSAAYYFIENFEKLEKILSKYGMEVSLDRVYADRFLEMMTRRKSHRRFRMDF